MWYLQAAKMGLNFLSAGMSYNADKERSKAQQAWQAYSNTMVSLSDAVNQNAITKNEILANEAFADQAIQNQKSGLISEAHVEVAAAAAGVKGRSVNQAMLDVQRNTANQEYQRQRSLRNANLAFDQQRLQSGLSAKMQTDSSYIPTPSGSSYFLNALSSSMSGTGFSDLFGSKGGSDGSGQVLATSGPSKGSYVTPTFFT
jgi:hypothetical protein